MLVFDTLEVGLLERLDAMLLLVVDSGVCVSLEGLEGRDAFFVMDPLGMFSSFKESAEGEEKMQTVEIWSEFHSEQIGKVFHDYKTLDFNSMEV